MTFRPETRVRARLLATAALALMGGETAWAQDATELDEIRVESASPIAGQEDGPDPDGDRQGVLPVATQVFAPVTIVPRDEIARGGAQTLGGALSQKPGIASTGFAPGAADRPIIRGLEGQRVRILENGLGVHDVSALGEDHAAPFNPLSADRIEVIRGPATLRYGSSAIGGVVNATNGRIPQFAPPGGFSAEALAGLSSVDRGRSIAARVDAGHKGILFHADGFAARARDYDTPDGRQENSASRSAGASVGVAAVTDEGRIGVSFSHYDAFYRVPGGESAELETRLDPEQDKVQFEAERRFDDGPFEAVRLWANASRYRHREIGLEHEEHDHGHEDHDHNDHDEHADGGSVVHGVFRNREVEARMELQHRPVALSFGGLTGAFGVQVGRGKLETTGEADTLIAPTDSRTLAAYVFEEIDFGGGLRLQGAGRIERARVDGTATLFPGLTSDGAGPVSRDRVRGFTPMSGSLGLLKSLPHGFVASVTAQYVERAPSGLELFSRGPHHAQGLFEIGDPNLKIEAAKSIEIGLKRVDGPLRLDASAYATRFDGFIYRRLTGVSCGHEFESCGEEDEFDQSVYSQRKARSHGAELAAQWDALEVGPNVFGLEGQYDFVRAKFSNGENVPRIPPHRLGGGAFWRSQHGFFARIGLLHAFAQDKTGPIETRTPGYDDLRAELSYTRDFDRAGVRPGSVTVGLVGQNLLDERIRNAASFKKDEILMPGANVRAFVRARF
jgi:iron complex outermembrane receptor protein